MMDKRWEELDNPEANDARATILAGELVRPTPIWPGPEGTKEQWAARHAFDQAVHYRQQARQEQEVLDKRELIEQLAVMVSEHKARAEEIEQFAIEHDIPGVCGWSGIENFIDNDIVGDAIRWAASNHNC